MTIQYLVPGFEPTTSWTWVSSQNHYTRARALAVSLFLSVHACDNQEYVAIDNINYILQVACTYAWYAMEVVQALVQNITWQFRHTMKQNIFYKSS